MADMTCARCHAKPALPEHMGAVFLPAGTHLNDADVLGQVFVEFGFCGDCWPIMSKELMVGLKAALTR